MQFLRSSWLVLLATVIGVGLFWFRPGGIEGPRVTPVAAEGKGFEHDAFDRVLAQALKADGTVDYAALAKDRTHLDHYLGQLAATAPGNAGHRFKTNDDRLAYYVNAYNAFVIAGVLDQCPVSDVNAHLMGGGFFWRLSFQMGQADTTLSDLEGLIRSAMGGDAAVRLALNKGAKGFPPPPAKALRGDTVHAQLAEHAQAALRLPQIARVEGDTVIVSKIFEWYARDFGDALPWIERTAPGLIPPGKTARYDDFDWSLNGACP
ncbi:MAG: DUF547 domain-containing protein [Myxococcales bacterium]|nr:DUF547 domain-containing protein [Myxococcales bacterium]